MKGIVEIRTPRAIIFGTGSAKSLSGRISHLADGPVLIVTDKGLAKAGVADRIKSNVLSAGSKVGVFDAVEPDPDKDNVYNCLEKLKSFQAKLVMGVGGGSSLDVAKICAMLAVNGGEIDDYLGIGKVSKKGLATVLVPTTAGTGSEVSPIAIVSDRKEHLKLGIVSEHLYCDLAIIDPVLTVSCPAKITAASGMDALTHAIEIYTNKFASAAIDPLQIEAIHLIGKNLSRCVHEGADLASREGMSLAALYAGLGLGAVNTAAVHALAYPLGAMFDIAHGLANSVLLPYVMEFNQPVCQERFAKVAEALGVIGPTTIEEKAQAAVQKVIELSKDVGIPKRMREIGIPEDAISQMAESAAKVTRLLNNNPREMTVEDIKKIYRQAY